MAQRAKTVVANWKMHGSATANAELLFALRAACVPAGDVAVAVCTPFPYLGQARDVLQGSAIAWGAQDVSEYAPGAYTGDVALEMLQDFGCTLTLTGHSERRAWYAESNQRSAAKAHRAIRGGLRAILCVGERLDQRQLGQTGAVVQEQLDALLALLKPQDLPLLMVAYEPVWAIGTGKTATPDEAQAVHEVIRAALRRVDDKGAESVPVLYGGSVKPGNARTLFAMPDIDGGLIGGASLVAADFLAIVAAAAEAK